MTQPETQTNADDAVVRTAPIIMVAYSGSLVLVGLLAAFLLVPEPTVTPEGLLIGAGLGLVSWFVPIVVVRGRLTAAARAGVAPETVPAVVRSAMFLGVIPAAMPALLAFAYVTSFDDSKDIGALILSIPLAVASLFLNVGGKGAMRRHLERLRSPFMA